MLDADLREKSYGEAGDAGIDRVPASATSPGRRWAIPVPGDGCLGRGPLVTVHAPVCGCGPPGSGACETPSTPRFGDSSLEPRRRPSIKVCVARSRTMLIFRATRGGAPCQLWRLDQRRRKKVSMPTTKPDILSPRWWPAPRRRPTVVAIAPLVGVRHRWALRQVAGQRPTGSGLRVSPCLFTCSISATRTSFDDWRSRASHNRTGTSGSRSRASRTSSRL